MGKASKVGDHVQVVTSTQELFSIMYSNLDSAARSRLVRTRETGPESNSVTRHTLAIVTTTILVSRTLQ